MSDDKESAQKDHQIRHHRLAQLLANPHLPISENWSERISVETEDHITPGLRRFPGRTPGF